MASTTNRVMKPSEWEQLGLALRREKAVQTKWQPARGAGCAGNSTASGGGRRMSLDIPFYRTFPPLRRLRLYEQKQKPQKPDISAVDPWAETIRTVTKYRSMKLR
jgi:hypothetical protein